MGDGRGRREPSAGSEPAEGVRPSPRARERLATDLRSEVEATRAAWYDALLRGRERLLAGDDHGAMEAIEDQRRLLQLLERRLERVVASAAVEREAEGVLAGIEASGTTGPSLEDLGEVTPPRPVDAEDAREVTGGRLRALVAAGAAAAVTALAVGLGVLVGPVTTPAPEVAGPVDAEADHAGSEAGDADGHQDVGTAERTSPLPVEPPPASAAWPRDWRDLWSSGRDAGDAPADVARPERDEAEPQRPEQPDDADAATDTPGPAAEDDPEPQDGPRDDADADADGDGDEPDPQDQDELLDLRRLLGPEDDAGEDEELPEADTGATTPPGDGLGERDDGAEETAGISSRLDGRP